MLILHDALQVVTCAGHGPRGAAGAAMREIGVRAHASVCVDGDRVAGVFPAAEVRPAPRDTVIDCRGTIVVPGFVDSHTHALFAGTRVEEFARRVAGRTYQEIAAAGGGIVRTMKAVRTASEKELVDGTRPRLAAALRTGTTTIEIKSGYGLATDHELKMLRAIRTLAAGSNASPLPAIHPTFLGAHAVPPEFAGRREAYVACIVDEMIPAVATGNLAESCDVFCDEGYFTLAETARILDTAQRAGMTAKVHVDELADVGGAALVAARGALSADHLLHVNAAGIIALREARTVATLLPGTAYFLGLPYAPARNLIDAGCAVALASDFNPGSSPVSNMQLVLSLACTQMKMSVEEALTAATVNGAAALGCADRAGAIAPGMRADLLVCAVPDYRELAYWFGGNLVRTVIRAGTAVA